MRKNNTSHKWIYFIPLSIFMYLFGYILVRMVIATILMLFFPSIPIDVSQDTDFGGHYVYATILFFFKDGLPTGFAIFLGVKFVPKYTQRVFAAFFVVWILYVCFNSYFLVFQNTDYSSVVFLLLVSSILGQLVSIIFAGYFLKRHNTSSENRSKAKIYNPDYF